ncbi:MAG: (d)CMP kinase [Candidatus Meridianibacter frigidus]|nr:MAG: (d)CMP kinase [Candidatus Eremiobacteraeota bacterium]
MSDADSIAIDGPAASGKTTVGRLVARRLNYLYLDTGAMYRALTALADETQTHLDNQTALVHLLEAHPMRVELDAHAAGGYRIFTGGREVTPNQLIAGHVTAGVSTVAAHPQVRAQMVRAQRAIAARGPVVMAGRDIGTVVLPNARVKIFLTASLEERVARRRAELEESVVRIDAARLRQEIQERDRLDESRSTAPLRQAAGAKIIDSTGMTADEVAAAIVACVPSVS